MLQDMASWSRDGIAGLQSVVLYSLPELDGAIDTVPLGGLVGDNIFLVSERVTRLSQRIKKWVHLRRSQPQVCHVLPLLPCPALIIPALSVFAALPSSALPHSAQPCRPLPCPASMFAALPCSALPRSALPCLYLLRCPALPCCTLSCPALPCPALPYPGKFLMPKVLVTGSVQLFNIAVWLPIRTLILDTSINMSFCHANVQFLATSLHHSCHLQLFSIPKRLSCSRNVCGQ